MPAPALLTILQYSLWSLWRLSNEIITTHLLNTYQFNYIVEIQLALFPDLYVQNQSHKIGLGKCLFSQMLNGALGILCFIPLCLLLQRRCWESTGIFH